MLLKADLLAEIKAGKVDTVFRRWKRSTVRAGGTLTTSAGVLAIDSITPIALDEVRVEDARRAGFADLEAFLAWLDTMKDGDLCIIRLHYAGEDPRLALRDSADLSDAVVAEIDAVLAKIDGKAPWTAAALKLIADNPERRADQLAAQMGQGTLAFKTRVRKLKALGLTESLEVGYRLSARGRAFLDRRR